MDMSISMLSVTIASQRPEIGKIYYSNHM